MSFRFKTKSGSWYQKTLKKFSTHFVKTQKKIKKREKATRSNVKLGSLRNSVTLPGVKGVFKNYLYILDGEHLLIKNRRFWPKFQTGT